MSLLTLTLVLAVGGAAQLLAGRLAAAQRHAMGALTLLCAMLLPAIQWLAPTPVYTYRAGTGLAAITNAAASTRALPWITIVWAIGAALVFARFSTGLIYLAHRTRHATPWPQSFADADIRLAAVSTPLVWGLWRPTVLLPLDASAWTPGHLRLVLHHETAHIARRDLAVAALANFTQALYWFHPLVWWLAARLRAEQELACDEYVLAAGVSAPDYADVLLNAARTHTGAPLFGCAMISHPDTLKGRIMHILQAPARSHTPRWTRLLPFAFGLLLLALSTLSAQQAPYRIGGDVKPPKLVHKVEPEYTFEAKDAKIEGRVVLQIVITDRGEPSEIVIVSGLDVGLDRNAVSAVRQWVFEPGTKQGVAVPVLANVEVKFKLK